MSAVYVLTIRQLASRGRLAIMAVLAGMPVFITTMMIWDTRAPSVEEFETVILSGMLAGSIAPLVVLAIASVAFSNELEDRTLANLTLTPIPRWKIVLPKLLGTITVAGPFVAISAATTAHIAFNADLLATIAVTAGALGSVALYASSFVYLGLVTTQAIGLGLLYIVLWEGFFSGFISGVRLFSIRHYTVSLMQGLDGRRFESTDTIEGWIALAVTLAVMSAFTLLAVRRLRRMDVP